MCRSKVRVSFRHMGDNESVAAGIQSGRYHEGDNIRVQQTEGTMWQKGSRPGALLTSLRTASSVKPAVLFHLFFFFFLCVSRSARSGWVVVFFFFGVTWKSLVDQQKKEAKHKS